MSLFPQLLLATTNKGKVKEFRQLLASLPATILTPADLKLDLEVDETGNTYTENAALKAKAYATLADIPVIADDSGLEVDVLSGAPGVRSARFSPKLGATDADRRRFLLDLLNDYPRPWTARFRCVIAIASPDPSILFCEGICEGEIVPEERGGGGFGYDPIFLVENTGLTMAELSFEEKNRISHRARAVIGAYPFLEEIIQRQFKE